MFQEKLPLTICQLNKRCLIILIRSRKWKKLQFPRDLNFESFKSDGADFINFYYNLDFVQFFALGTESLFNNAESSGRVTTTHLG